ncbi:hypothetical protein TB2_000199 [Malus domestica]
MEEGNSLGVVRKGAWTKEEDDLLQHFVQQHGEGKWRQVPLKAGLNRCRKSCRLRWLNYLKPSIKRGDFGEDEIDLMLEDLFTNFWIEEDDVMAHTTSTTRTGLNCSITEQEEEGLMSRSDYFFSFDDMDIWNNLSMYLN